MYSAALATDPHRTPAPAATPIPIPIPIPTPTPTPPTKVVPKVRPKASAIVYPLEIDID